MLKKLNIEQVLFIDIETVSQTANFSQLSENWQQLWEHKIKFQLSEEDTPESLYDRAGIYAEFGKIICISAGYVFQKNGERMFRVKSFHHNEEKVLIAEFFEALKKFEAAGKRKLCAHNGQEFDYPYIARRALVNNLRLPRIFDIAGQKPWETKEYLMDTLQLWKFGDYKHYTSLSLLCALFNIPTPKDDIDGSEVGRVYWEDKDTDRIIRYCEKDTLAVANLILRYKGEQIIAPENMMVV